MVFLSLISSRPARRMAQVCLAQVLVRFSFLSFCAFSAIASGEGESETQTKRVQASLAACRDGRNKAAGALLFG